MIIGKIEVSGTTATVHWSTDIPKGLVGGKVQITYTDDVWPTLNKAVVFRGAVTRDVLDNGSEVTVPAEVLSRSGTYLYVGVYGTDAENELGLPTFWAKLGVIRDAADPEGDPAADPSLPVWAGLLERTPDWNAPPESDNHILNRTHWIGENEGMPTFDGTLSGKKYVQLGTDFYFVKITDQTLPMEDFIGAVCILHNNGETPTEEEFIITEDMLSDGTEYGVPAFVASELICVARQAFTLEGIFFEEGIYFLCVPTEDGGYVKSCSALEGLGFNIHKLDNKFIDAEWMANRIDGSEVILETATHEFTGSSRKTARQFFQFTLEAGETYQVTWDEDTYECTAGEIREESIAAAYLGNLYLLDDEYPDTGEPFAIACLSVMGFTLLTQIAAMDTDATSHTIGIKQVGMVRNRIPVSFMPQRYIFPSDFSYVGIVEDELEQAFIHQNNGGEVFASYANTAYKVLRIHFDMWDGRYHYLVMTDGRTLMIWSASTGWSRYSSQDIILRNSDGKAYRIYVDSSGNLATSATSL